jgi:hypothetical protein
LVAAGERWRAQVGERLPLLLVDSVVLDHGTLPVRPVR